MQASITEFTLRLALRRLRAKSGLQSRQPNLGQTLPPSSGNLSQPGRP